MSFGEVLTAMVTPFNEDLTINYEQAVGLANYLVDNGSDGLVVLGTTGEVPTLSSKEKVKLLEVIVEAVGDKAKIIAGTGSYSTQASIDFTKEAEEIGVDGVMLVTPYYNKPPQEGLYNHFKMVAEATDLPIMLYNVPGRTSRNIEPETIVKLAEIDNIIAVKEASGNLDQVIKIRSLTDDNFKIYSGDDSLTLPILSIGGEGVVSVASHLVGNEIKAMISDFKAGKIKEAAQQNAKLNKLFSTMFISTNPIPVKAALNLVGKEVGGLRPPLVELTEELEERLKSVLQEYDLVD
ncbi:4-hydroxy-tetrahydrodipicolinate synthase [Orenia metallireducens]|jgi:4-hydroxy-tetrahydrodipicolinate synthase|uniref:4-hydroxy-tetrahydrodipicolinate synthase n=1 Tax=Orenia metallireducens TaxID=1413210 RepID=A0A1C0AA75_9FIRM|nr:4-hydroxy-tetrahydrodipicolinate synthase [Orenia metallireducens]OCL27159.1 4-hydroxy-tetrahydrodipicolinate synthase [Orenia metallireducens]